VEEREVGAAASRREPVGLDACAPAEAPSDTTSGAWDGAGIHRLTS
jgi:hypothetical protein